MEYRLFEYAPVMYNRKTETYSFYEPAGKENHGKIFQFSISESNPELKTLLSGSFLSETALSSLFGEETVRDMVISKILTDEDLPSRSISQRTRDFFEQYYTKEQFDSLKEKKVLVLGCGGIGTHIAWNLAVLGVGTICLIDFDLIEESNLNRQILYTLNDIGKPKSEILAAKLREVTKNITVVSKNIKVSSQKHLEEIIKSDDYSLIVKALDSPTQFPLWLDHICKKHHLPYVSGLTYKNKAMVGPVFIPGISKYGWSDIIDVTAAGDKVFGTVSSIGIVLNNISDKLSIEAVKILTGVGTPNYIDTIEITDLFVNTTEYLTGKRKKSRLVKQNVDYKILLNLYCSVLCAILSFLHSPLLALSFVSGIIVPFLLLNSRKAIQKNIFINSIVVSASILLKGFSRISHYFVLSFFSALCCCVVSFCLTSIVALIMCTIGTLFISGRQ